MHWGGCNREAYYTQGSNLTPVLASETQGRIIIKNVIYSLFLASQTWRRIILKDNIYSLFLA